MFAKLRYMAKNRICVLFGITTILFSILILRVYDLQIVNGEEHLSDARASIIRTESIDPLRGNIYDRYGMPLAINKVSINVKYDLSVAVNDLNGVFIEFLRLLDLKNEKYFDELPISEHKPYKFTFTSDSAEKNWKIDMGFKNSQLDLTAEESLKYLNKLFEIPDNLSEEEVRRLISIRSRIYIQRYKKYNSITLANNVGSELIAAIEELKYKFPGIYIEPDSFRYYTQGESMSHILGYVGSINENELEQYSEYGYTQIDKLGKLGIEKTYELTLKGKSGEKVIEVDSIGRRVNETETIKSTAGSNVYLTIDSKLQNKSAEIINENLKQVLINSMNMGKVNLTKIYQSMINSNAISIKKIMDADINEFQYDIKKVITKNNSKLDLSDTDDLEVAKDTVISAIGSGEITQLQLTMCLYEQGIISIDMETIENLKQGRITAYSIIKEKIIQNEISINKINIEPCTGSVAVVDVNTGEVLSLVTYPSYDNNKLVNVFDNEYYKTLLNDPTTPLINRPLMERKAPGSILKMMTAVAGLETGVVNKNTLIGDKGEFKDAGKPYAKCLIYSRYGSTHGLVDVKKAIEVSCNYYFYELAYRLGNAKDGTTLNSIAVMEKYMSMFGLNEYSGIEIEESKPKMASPESKEELMQAYYENPSESQKKWMDGDSIRCAIGQANNSFSAMNMAKYIATLANGGVRYKTTVVKGYGNEMNLDSAEPVVELNLDLKENTLNAVHEGMLSVTEGSQGSLRNFFKDFPIKVGGKTGTAEEAAGRPSHSWFAGYAPYDNPQIAVVVMIPFGETTDSPAIKIAKEIIEEYFGLHKETEKSVVYSNVLMK